MLYIEIHDNMCLNSRLNVEKKSQFVSVLAQGKVTIGCA